jgi:hypothetical protein
MAKFWKGHSNYQPLAQSAWKAIEAKWNIDAFASQPHQGDRIFYQSQVRDLVSPAAKGEVDRLRLRLASSPAAEILAFGCG